MLLRANGTGPEALAEKPKSAHINCCEKLTLERFLRGETDTVETLQYISARAFSERCSTIHVYKVRHSNQADFEQENSVE